MPKSIHPLTPKHTHDKYINVQQNIEYNQSILSQIEHSINNMRNTHRSPAKTL
jgi:hypothetical protein